MRLSLGIRAGDRIAGSLAVAIGLSDDGESVCPRLMEVSREFAFSSTSVDDFALWYLRSELFSKFRSEGSEDLALAAIAKFAESERTCELVNDRLVDPWTRASLTQSTWRRARGIISSVLGRFPWEEFPAGCGFGPGASSGILRRQASHQQKWAASAHITEKALPYHQAFIHWAGLDLIPSEMEVVQGNRVTTVPKSFKTDRVIAIEPDWNMFYQKGVGRLIRRRLNGLGLLLPDAQEKNRALARLGSWTGSLATLDLRGASDSISVALCEALLPDDWMRVVLDLRSPVGQLGASEEPVTYAKISSMGNGFTFELETLLFYALTLASSGKGNLDRISVFGDDIICPTEAVDDVVGTLNEAGFEINDTKSFSSGPFRESCGGHYWQGKDVTPFYLRKPPSSINDTIVLGNALVTWCAARGMADLGPFDHVHRLCKGVTPRALRGPYGLAGCLWDEWDRCIPTWHRDTQSYRQLVIAPVTVKVDHSENPGGYLHGLWTGTEEHEASFGLSASERLKAVRVACDREMWSVLPVRTA